MRTVKEKLIVKVEEKKAGNIVIPDIVNVESTAGEVIAIGADVKEIEIGDKILFSPKAGEEIATEDKRNKYLVLYVNNVLAIL